MFYSEKEFESFNNTIMKVKDINKELDLTLEIIYHETKNKAEIIAPNNSEIPDINVYRKAFLLFPVA